MAADLFETYAVTAVAVMLLGVLTFDDAQATQVILYPLVLGGVSIIASIIGTFAVKSASGNVERALYQGMVLAGVIAAILFYPVTNWMMDDLTRQSGASAPGVGDIYLCALIGLGVTAAAVRDHRLLHLARASRRSRRRLRRRRPATRRTSSRASRQGLQATALPALVIVARHLRGQRARRDLRRRRGRHGPAVADRPDRGARRVRPDHRQRRRHRRDGRHARGRPQRHRPARRGRQHHEGRHQGLRDRLGRARRARAVRGVQDRAPGGARPAGRCSRSTIRTS